jgi:hypothetical protein
MKQSQRASMWRPADRLSPCTPQLPAVAPDAANPSQQVTVRSPMMAKKKANGFISFSLFSY